LIGAERWYGEHLEATIRSARFRKLVGGVRHRRIAGAPGSDWGAVDAEGDGSGTNTPADDLGGNGFVGAGGGDEIIGFGAGDLVQLDGLARLEFDDLEGMFEVGIAGDKDGRVVAILEGQGEHVNGEHDVNAFLHLPSTGQSLKASGFEGEIRDEAQSVEEPLLGTGAPIFSGVLWIIAPRPNEGGVVIVRVDMPASGTDEFDGQLAEINLDGKVSFLEGVIEIAAVDEDANAFHAARA